MILDELDFALIDRLLAGALYRSVASRYQWASTIVTPHKSFQSSAGVSLDAVIVRAVLDCLVDDAYLVPIVDGSYRYEKPHDPQEGRKEGCCSVDGRLRVRSPGGGQAS